MNWPVFLEVIMQAEDLNKLNFGGRDEIEDPLEAALAKTDFAKVSGGGGGSVVAIIDVDVKSEDKLDEALKIIQRVLRDVAVPPSTIIKQEKGTGTFSCAFFRGSANFLSDPGDASSPALTPSPPICDNGRLNAQTISDPIPRFTTNRCFSTAPYPIRIPNA